METLAPIVTWVAPIASTLIITWLTAVINKWMGESKKEREREESERREWRASVDKKLSEQDGTIRSVLEAQCTQMRSDITHKIHRYMDDLHCASTEEKQSLWAEYEVYSNICKEYGIENHFVEQLVNQVMDLPDRPF